MEVNSAPATARPPGARKVKRNSSSTLSEEEEWSNAVPSAGQTKTASTTKTRDTSKCRA